MATKAWMQDVEHRVAVFLGAEGIEWLSGAKAMVGAHACRLQIITESQFSALTVEGAVNAPPTATAIPAGTTFDFQFTAITQTSGLSVAVLAPA